MTRQVCAGKANGSEPRMLCRKTLNRHRNQVDLAAWDQVQQEPVYTHESSTDPDARLYKKSYGKESHLAYLGHALVENRNGLIAAAYGDPGRRLCRARSRAADASGQAKRPQASHHR